LVLVFLHRSFSSQVCSFNELVAMRHQGSGGRQISEPRHDDNYGAAALDVMKMLPSMHVSCVGHDEAGEHGSSRM